MPSIRNLFHHNFNKYIIYIYIFLHYNIIKYIILFTRQSSVTSLLKASAWIAGSEIQTRQIYKISRKLLLTTKRDKLYLHPVEGSLPSAETAEALAAEIATVHSVTLAAIIRVVLPDRPRRLALGVSRGDGKSDQDRGDQGELEEVDCWKGR